MKNGWLILFLLACTVLRAQDSLAVKNTDSSIVKSAAKKKNLAYYLSPISIKHNPKSARFDFQLDIRNSFVKDFPINVYGANIGVVIRKRFRIGAGYYWINQDFNDKLLGIAATGDRIGKPIITSKGVPVPISTLNELVTAGKIQSSDFIVAAQQLDLWFVSLAFSYTFYSSRLVDLSIPLEFGYGGFQEKLYDISGNNFASIGSSLKPQATTGNFFPGQVGVNLLLKVHRWFYLNGTYGYRQTISQSYTTKYRATSFDSQFNGEYYNIGVKVQIGTIIKDLKRRHANISPNTKP